MRNVEKQKSSIYHRAVLMRSNLGIILNIKNRNKLTQKNMNNICKKSVLKRPSKNINLNYINVKSLFFKKPHHIHFAWVHRTPNCFGFAQPLLYKNTGRDKFKQLKKISAQKRLVLKLGQNLFKKSELRRFLRKNNSIKALTYVEKSKSERKRGKSSFINVLSKHFLAFSKKRAHLANFRREKAWENFLFWRPLKNFIQVRTIKQSMFINYYFTKLLGKNTHVFLTEPFVKFYNLPHKKFINMHVKRNLVRSKNLYFAKRVQYYQNMHYLINFFVKFTALGVANLFLEHMATQLTRDSRHWLFLKLLKQFFQITFNKESLNFNRMRFVLKGKFRGPARKSKRLIRFKDNREIALQTFTSKVDYSYYPADTKYGTISIKLWIFYKKELIMPSQFVNKYEKI